jgi:hypothetical protein
MHFHFPSFWFQFERRFGAGFDVYHHNLTIYIVTQDAAFTRHQLMDIITDALLASLQDPLAAPHRPTWKPDIIAGPLPGHLDALADALLYRCDFVACGSIQTAAGEMQEYRIDVRALERIVIEVRKAADVKLGRQILQGELVTSINLMTQRIYHQFGRAFAEKRVREMLKTLEQQGVIHGNGNLRTRGRDVIQ